jgi:hypothetical protein
MTAEVLAKAMVRDVAPAQTATKEVRDKSARHDEGSLETSGHAGATQQGEPGKCQPRQEPQPKPNLQLTLQPAPRHDPKSEPKPPPIAARRWETVQPPIAESEGSCYGGNLPGNSIQHLVD